MAKSWALCSTLKSSVRRIAVWLRSNKVRLLAKSGDPGCAAQARCNKFAASSTVLQWTDLFRLHVLLRRLPDRTAIDGAGDRPARAGRRRDPAAVHHGLSL